MEEKERYYAEQSVFNIVLDLLRINRESGFRLLLFRHSPQLNHKASSNDGIFMANRVETGAISIRRVTLWMPRIPPYSFEASV